MRSEAKCFFVLLFLVYPLPGSLAAAAYYGYDSAVALIDGYVAAHPDLVKKVSYGTSPEGRDMFAVKLSDNVHVDEPEVEISIDGATHGEEQISAEMSLRLLRDLVEQYGVEPELTQLVDQREIWFFPFINPDGYERNYRFNPNGVDLNRDYGYMWWPDGGSRYPFSQPETRAVFDWINDHQFVFSIHMHAGFQAVFSPWGFTPEAPPDRALLDRIAELYFASSGYTSLTLGAANTAMYPTHATFYDYVYGSRGTLAWLVEVNVDKFPPSSQVESLYQKNRPALLELLHQAGYGVGGFVRDANTGAALAATLWASTADGTHYWPTASDPAVGDYHRYLAPGEHQLRVEANGYEPQTIVVTVPGSGRAVVDIALQPDAGPDYAQQVLIAHANPPLDPAVNLTTHALRAPDGLRYSFGDGGWLVLDTGADYTAGEDVALSIVEDDTDPEGYTVQLAVAPTGPYTAIGRGTGSQLFYLDRAGVDRFRYVRLIDDRDGGDGLDLDAIAVYRGTAPTGVPEGEPVETVMLTPGVRDSGLYGYNYQGVYDNLADVRFGFEGGTTALQLELDGYDVSFLQEIGVYLNGELLGYINGSPNTVMPGGSWRIEPAQQRPGGNELIVGTAVPYRHWGVSRVLLQQAVDPPPPGEDCPAHDVHLILGSVDSGAYGNAAGLQDVGAELVAVFDAPQPTQDLRFSLRAYDSDADREIELLLNGSSLGFLADLYPDNNNTWSAQPDLFGIGAENLLAGCNTLTVRQARNASWVWGVRELELSVVSSPPPPPPPGDDCLAHDVQLTLGSVDSGAYGNAAGLQDVGTELVAVFDAPEPAQDLRFSLRAYDSNATDEIEVQLNGASLGFLASSRKTNRNAWSAQPDQFQIAANDLLPGCNTLTARQARNPQWDWGVRELLLE